MVVETKTPVERPGCVTVYAFLMGLGSVLLLLMVLFFLVAAEPLPLFMYVLGGFVGVLNLVIAAGLWGMEEWARVAVIVTTGLSMLGNAFSACMATIEVELGDLFSSVLGIAVGGYIIHWFANNQALFREVGALSDKETFLPGSQARSGGET